MIVDRAKRGLRTDAKDLDRLTDDFARIQNLLAREAAVKLREDNVAQKEADWGSVEEREEQLNERARYLAAVSGELQTWTNELRKEAEEENEEPERHRIRDWFRRNR